MTEVTFSFDNKATKAINELMTYYNVKTRAELIAKAISILKIAAHVSQTEGELIARSGKKEAKIIGY